MRHLTGLRLHDIWRDWNVSFKSLSYNCRVMLTGHVDNNAIYSSRYCPNFKQSFKKETATLLDHLHFGSILL